MKLPDRGRKRGYFLNFALGFDQWAGTWFGIDADESISSYCGRTKAGRWQQVLIDRLFLEMFNESDHCNKSIERHDNCR